MARLPHFRIDKPPSRDRWEQELGEQLITTRAALPKYSRLFGVPLSRILLAGWLRKGHLKRVGRSVPGSSTVFYEAELAYCAEVHAWRRAVGIPQNIPLLSAGGRPSLPTTKTMAQIAAEYRQRKANGIRLRRVPRSKPKGTKPSRTSDARRSKKP